MTAGLSLMKKLCVQQSRTTFRQINPAHFLEEERPLYQFVDIHYRSYGALPTMEALADNGFASLAMIRDNEPAEYYLSRLAERFVVLQSRDVIQSFQDAVISGNAAAIKEIITALGGVVRQQGQASSVLTIGQAAEMVIDMYDTAHANPGIQGITFGYDWLDEITGGAQAGDMITLAASTGMGKSYYLAFMAISAWLSGASVLFISMEMTVIQMVTRMIGLYTGINPELIRRGTLSHWTEARFRTEAMAMNEGPPFVIVDGSFRLGMADLDPLIQEFNPDITYIDALYLMTPLSERFTEKGHERSREQSKDVKKSALARHKPIVISTQLGSEGRMKKREQLHGGMIGGTIGISQDSQTVMLIAAGPGAQENIMRDIILDKNREGAKGWMRANFLFNPVDLGYVTCDAHEGQEVTAPSGWSA